LSRLLVSVEAYPQLTATKGFQDLQSQLEGTENRIGVARGDFNAVAAQWNIMITQFPRVVIARFFGFEKAVLFDAQTGSDVAPKIEFDIK
jgi:LemA protein